MYSKATTAASSTDANASRGGSVNKSNELKTTMDIANIIIDLKEPPYFLTRLSVSPLVCGDIPSSWRVELVRKPYTMPVKVAPVCDLQMSRPPYKDFGFSLW